MEVMNMMQQVYQVTTTGQVVISQVDGNDLKFSNGGVDGEFQVFVTDIDPVPELFDQVGELLTGQYVVKGIPIGKDVPEIKLDGHYLVYGNQEDGNVMIVKRWLPSCTLRLRMLKQKYSRELATPVANIIH